MRGAIRPLPYTSSWRGTWLSTGKKFTLPLFRYFYPFAFVNIERYRFSTGYNLEVMFMKQSYRPLRNRF